MSFDNHLQNSRNVVADPDTSCRGRLEPESKSPGGWSGWRWLQCTDIPGEYEVLLPPVIARCYARLLEVEEQELRKSGSTTGVGMDVNWRHVAALRHVKERLIKRCCRLEDFKPYRGYGSFQNRKIHAPPDFTLLQLERWERDQRVFGYARPSKHRTSPFMMPQQHLRPQSTFFAETTTPTPAPIRMPIKPSNHQTLSPSASTPLRPTSGKKHPNYYGTPTSVSGINKSPITPVCCHSGSVSGSGCIYVVFRCPRHCPADCCGEEGETQFSAGHPSPCGATNMPPSPAVAAAKVAPRHDLKAGCKCCYTAGTTTIPNPSSVSNANAQNVHFDTPASAHAYHRATTATATATAPIPISAVNESSLNVEPVLHSSPPAPSLMQQLPTPVDTALMTQKPLPPSPPRRELSGPSNRKDVGHNIVVVVVEGGSPRSVQVGSPSSGRKETAERPIVEVRHAPQPPSVASEPEPRHGVQGVSAPSGKEERTGKPTVEKQHASKLPFPTSRAALAERKGKQKEVDRRTPSISTPSVIDHHHHHHREQMPQHAPFPSTIWSPIPEEAAASTRTREKIAEWSKDVSVSSGADDHWPPVQGVPGFVTDSDSSEEEDFPKTPPPPPPPPPSASNKGSGSLKRQSSGSSEKLQKTVRFDVQSSSSQNIQANDAATASASATPSSSKIQPPGRKPVIRKPVPNITITPSTPRESPEMEYDLDKPQKNTLSVPKREY